MATRDLDSRITESLVLAPVSVTSNTTRNSSWVDCANVRYVEFIHFGGSITDGTYTPAIQESDDQSTITSVATGRIIGGLTALSAGNTVHSIGVQPTKRYVRLQSTSASTSTGAHAIGAVAIAGNS